MNHYTELFNQCLTINDCIKLKEELSNSTDIKNIKDRLKIVTPEEKKDLGKELNLINSLIKEANDQRIKTIQEEQEKDHFLEYDPSFTSGNNNGTVGKLHPLTVITKELIDTFVKLGFEISNGPLVEEQWYNFTSLNMPHHHPARAMQDTFYFQNQDHRGENLVLRTHTSASQVRFGQVNKPPFKMVVPGLVFRNEEIDRTHDINFQQIECIYIDKQVSISQLKTLILQVFQEFFKKEMKIRLRPSYFPFVNPGMEGDISCPFCDQEGCKVCKQSGWIECFGGGMIHPEVISNMNLDPNQWQGLAFAFGIDRMAQFRLGVSGISQFYNGRLEFLK